MHRIYRTSDRVPVKIDDITILVSPLTYAQKAELQAIMVEAIKNPMASMDGAFKAIQFGVKGISGVTDMDGQAYEVEFDGDKLSDNCVNELLNLQIQDRLIPICIALIGGIPAGFTNPQTGEPLKGVSLEAPKSPKPKARSK